MATTAGRGEQAEHSPDVWERVRQRMSTQDSAPLVRSAQQRSFAVWLLAFRGCAKRRKLGNRGRAVSVFACEGSPLPWTTPEFEVVDVTMDVTAYVARR